MDRIDGGTTDDGSPAPAASVDGDDHAGQFRTDDGPDERDRTGSTTVGPSGPRLSSRVLVTWIELTVVGITGGLIGAAIGGPPGFIIHLATTLLTVGIVFYNVNELVREWVRATIDNGR